jgi:hypothetical protein
VFEANDITIEEIKEILEIFNAGDHEKEEMKIF